MANFNKVVMVGRLTREVEARSFSNGGKVAKIGFVVNNRKKGSGGEWEDDPMFIDVEAFNSQHGSKLADVLESYCKKGSQIMVEGRLVLDQWDDKTSGQKRSKHKIVAESIQLLDGKPSNGGGSQPAPASNAGGDYNSSPSGNQVGEEIPF